MGDRLRFVLDHDVDAAVVGALVKAGHEAWTVGAARLGRARDNDVAIYAARQAAVLVTHDRGLVRNLERNMFATVIWLHCEDDEAVEVIVRWLPELARRLANRRDDIVVEVRRGRVRIRRGQWQGDWNLDR